MAESESFTKLRERFMSWRSGKPHARAPIPQELWDAAVRATRAHSVAHVSKALGLDYSGLKRRARASDSEVAMAESQSAFVQLETTHRFSDTGCVIELEKVSGAKMTIRLEMGAAAILPGLVEAFATQRQ